MKKIKMVNQISEKTIEIGFKEFIRSCKVKNLSEKTIEYYDQPFAPAVES